MNAAEGPCRNIRSSVEVAAPWSSRHVLARPIMANQTPDANDEYPSISAMLERQLGAFNRSSTIDEQIPPTPSGRAQGRRWFRRGQLQGAVRIDRGRPDSPGCADVEGRGAAAGIVIQRCEPDGGFAPPAPASLEGGGRCSTSATAVPFGDDACQIRRDRLPNRRGRARKTRRRRGLHNALMGDEDLAFSHVRMLGRLRQ
jgi:hypothetical protein